VSVGGWSLGFNAAMYHPDSTIVDLVVRLLFPAAPNSSLGRLAGVPKSTARSWGRHRRPPMHVQRSLCAESQRRGAECFSAAPVRYSHCEENGRGAAPTWIFRRGPAPANRGLRHNIRHKMYRGVGPVEATTSGGTKKTFQAGQTFCQSGNSFTVSSAGGPPPPPPAGPPGQGCTPQQTPVIINCP
jgi:hypothetical protein